MDWISLLRSQQKDFLRRVKKNESREAIFLDASVFGCHAERLKFREGQFLEMLDNARQKAMTTVAHFTRSLADLPQEINAESQLILTWEQQVESYFYYEQISEQVINFLQPQQFHPVHNYSDDNLTIPDNYHPISNWLSKRKFSYQLTANPAINLQIEIHSSSDFRGLDSEQFSTQIGEDDIKNHQIILFFHTSLYPPPNHEPQVIFLGFVISQFLDLHTANRPIQLNELLYSGGLNWCIKWLQTQQQSPVNSSPTLCVTKHPLQSLIGDWECWQTLTGHTRGINCLAITPENPVYGTPSILATGSRGEIKLWNLTRGEFICTLSEYQWSYSGWLDEVNCLTFSPDGRMLISGSADATIKIWHVGARDLVDILHEHQQTIRCMAFTPNQRILVSGGDDRTILFWDLRKREIEGRLSLSGTGVQALAFNRNGDKLITGSHHHIQIWEASPEQVWQQFSLQPRQQIQTYTHHIRVLAVSSDGEYLVSGGQDQNMKIWKLATGELVRTLTGHQDSIHAIAIAPITSSHHTPVRGHLIASGSADRTVRLWHLETGEHLATFRGHSHTVTALTFTTSGEMIVSASLDKTIKIWQRSD